MARFKTLSFALIASFLFTLKAHASVESTLALYPSTDINNSCSVKLAPDGKFVTIYNSNSENQKTLIVRIGDLITDTQDVTVTRDTNYDGEAKLFLSREGNHLTVIGTWKDLENGYDRSVFCTVVK